MNKVTDPSMAAKAASSQELTDRKVQMDALKKRVSGGKEKPAKLREACEGFESVFIQKMWEQMRATLPKEGYLHGKEEQFWQSMFDQELSKKMASAGGIGLADMMYDQLSRGLGDASRNTGSIAKGAPLSLPLTSALPQKQAAATAAAQKGGMYGGEAEQPAAPAETAAAQPAAHEPTPPEVAQQLATFARMMEERKPDSVHNGVSVADAQKQLAARTAEAAASATGGQDAAAVAEPVKRVSAGYPTGDPTVFRSGTARRVSSPRLAGPGTRVSSSRGVTGRQIGGAVAQTDGVAQQDGGDGGGTAAGAQGVQRAAMAGPANAPMTGTTGTSLASPASAGFTAPPQGITTPEQFQQSISQMSGAAGSQPQGAGMARGVAPVSGAPAASAPAGSVASPVGSPAASPAAGPAAQPARVAPLGGPAPAGSPGAMQWPAEGRIAAGYGWRNDPKTGERGWHPGVDIAAPAGSPVKACWDGKVVQAGEQGDYGQLVVVEHAGGWRSYYGHNEGISVRVGDTVRAGTELARVGATGRAAGPHVHFEVRQGELALNPESFVKISG